MMFLRWLPTFFLLSLLTSQSFASQAYPQNPVKAVNLGGWLVTEGWITPSLFDQMPNNDLLDGTQVQFKSMLHDIYLMAVNGGGENVVANRPTSSGWANFKLWRVTKTTFQFKVLNDQFIGLDSQGQGGLVAVKSSPGTQETFEIEREPGDVNHVRIRAQNGLFLQVSSDGVVTADYPESSSWGDDDDPSVFSLTIVGTLRGDFQVTNGYGKEMATTIMREHWNSFVVEGDFDFMSRNGINTVRIPVGYWIASDDSPPFPFVGGSLQALDNAFTWADKYNLQVIVDLHAAPGSQNGFEHSGTRDGSQEWSNNNDNIDQTVAAVDFLAARYGQRSSFLAMELLNEPFAPGVSLDILEQYYQAGYDAVRKHCPNCYVIMSNRLGEEAGATELLRFAGGLDGSVVDVHYYNLYSDDFVDMTVQQNIDYVYNHRARELMILRALTYYNGPLIFIGEWVAEWNVQGASKEDYQSFAAAQLEVFGQATFGWAYWTFRSAERHWSLEWMVTNGYISLRN